MRLRPIRQKNGRGQMGDFPIDNLRAPDEIRLFRPSGGPKKIFRLLTKFADNEPILCITDQTIQHIAVTDLVITITHLLPVAISLLKNSRILGDALCYARTYITIMIYPAGMSLIAFLTTAKYLILRYPIRAATWTTRRVHKLCGCIWASLLTVPILFIAIDKDDVDFDYRTYHCMYGFKSNDWRKIKPIKI